jgi:hypothetical protein
MGFRQERKIPTWAAVLGVLGLFVFFIGIVFFFVRETRQIETRILTVTLDDGTTRQLVELNPGEPFGFGNVPWPRVGTVYPSIEFHTFRETTRVRVSYQGNVILEQTFTLDDERTETPVCAAVIDTPGVPG